MASLYRQLRQKGQVPDPIGELGAVTMGRLIGETGPLENHCPDYCRGLTAGVSFSTTGE